MEQKADKRGTVFGTWTFKIAVLAFFLIPVGGYMAYTALTDFKTTVTGGKAPPPVTGPLASQPYPNPNPPPPVASLPPPLPVLPPEPEKPKLSTRWRISGVAKLGNAAGLVPAGFIIDSTTSAQRLGGRSIVLLASATARRRIDMSECKLEGIDLDLRCIVDGEIVSYYSGDTGGFASAAITPDALNPNKQ